MPNPRLQINEQQGGSIWNHDNGYQIESATELGMSSWLDNLLDPTGLVSGFWNDLTGQTAQSREFSQQEYLQDKMNEYNTPVNQMQRMAAAGINPNIAASGIAGSGSESAQAPAVASNQGGVAQGISSVASMVGSGAQAALTQSQQNLNESQADEADASAESTKALITPTIQKLFAETANQWAQEGMNSNLADYWCTKALWANRQEKFSLMEKAWSIRHIQADIRLLKDQHKLNLKDLKMRSLQITEQEYKNEIIKIDKALKDGIYAAYRSVGVDPSLSRDGMLIEAEATGHLDRVLELLKTSDYNTAHAAYQAEVNTIADKTRKVVEEELKGKISEMITDANLKKMLMKFGIKGNMLTNLVDELTSHFMHYLFATDNSISVQTPLGGGSIQNGSE